MKNMRSICAVAAAVLLCVASWSLWAGGRAELPLSEPSRWSGDPLVGTRYGMVQGYEDADLTWVWKAIPFARPPVGELRWKAPRDPQPWSGVRRSREFSGGCTQYVPILSWIVDGSEDCLSLNVWRPRSDESGLPVYVWIHGGGNSMGSAAYVPDYYGSGLAAASNMVFVSVNYRLGPFGWFTHPALREGASPEDASGNYGTLDLIQALKWVRDNIEAFGGDPRNLIIAGESAGGMNVLSLLISPPARGLFSRALVESGAATTSGMAEADATAEGVLRLLLLRDGSARDLSDAGRIASSMSSAAIRGYLRSKSDREIIRCYPLWLMGMLDNPAILRDGFVIPSDGYKVLDTGGYASKVPLIIGSNAEELKLFLAFASGINWKSELYRAVTKYGSQRWKADGVDAIARKLASRPDQPPVYAYLFSWGAPDPAGWSPLPGEWGKRLGSFHSLDVPFFLGTDTIEGALFARLLFTRENRAGRKALSAAMMGYVARLVRTGNPNDPASGLPEWLPWSNEQGGPKHIVFNVQGDAPAIAMSTDETTIAGIERAMREELPPQLYEAASKFLSANMSFTSEK
jgi:para-nitrobenzyl esterase